MTKQIIEVLFKEYVEHRIAEHEIFLRFQDDWMAEAFDAWFWSVGFILFDKWARDNKKELEY
jgi:hypothetical protein